MEETHGTHPAAGVYKHPLEVLVVQDVTWVPLAKLNHHFGKGLLVILT